MANNRMYLCCSICANDPEKSLDDCIQYLAKYYPETGWYTPKADVTMVDVGLETERTTEVPNGLPEKIATFLETHGHQTRYGQHIVIIYEDTVSPCALEKRGVLDAIGNAVNEASTGKR